VQQEGVGGGREKIGLSKNALWRILGRYKPWRKQLVASWFN